MANGSANMDAQQGTLVGAPVTLSVNGFVPMSVEVYNFDTLNSYTLTFPSQGGTKTVTIPPLFKFGIQGPLTSMTLNGTGAWKMLAFDTLLPAPGGFSALYAIPATADPSPLKTVKVLIPALTGAGDDINLANIWLNATGATVQVFGVQLYSRAQTIGAFGPGDIAELEISNSGTAGLIASKTFDSAPGGGGANPWPAYMGSAPPEGLTNGAAADMLVAPGDSILLNFIESPTVQVGAFELQIYYRLV